MMSHLLDVLSLNIQEASNVVAWLNSRTDRIPVTGPECVASICLAWRMRVQKELGRAERDLPDVIAPERWASLKRYWAKIPDLEWFRTRMVSVLDPHLRVGAGRSGRYMGAAAAVTAAWNAAVIDLGREVSMSGTPNLPPSLSSNESPSWLWILEGWEAALPDLYMSTVSNSGTPPAGNMELGAILGKLTSIEENQS